MDHPVFQFFLVSLAVWRLSHLLGMEDGPWDLVFRLRKLAGNSFFGHLLDCFYCISIWVAVPGGLWLGRTWIEKILYWLALSGLACLLEQFSTRRPPSDEEPAFFPNEPENN